MSSIVSRRPSSRNHLNEAIWMSIRFGSSRTFSIREKDLRARGDATLVVNRKSLPWDVRNQLNAGVRAMGGRAGGRRRPGVPRLQLERLDLERGHGAGGRGAGLNLDPRRLAGGAELERDARAGGDRRLLRRLVDDERQRLARDGAPEMDFR